MVPLGGAGVGGAECGRRKAKSSNASVAVTSNDVEVGAEEGKRRGKTNILWKNATKSAHSIRAAHALRSVPFRCGQSRGRLGGTGRQTGPVHTGGQWVGCTCAMWHAACSEAAAAAACVADFGCILVCKLFN